jgi:hypothetical protein
MIFFSAQIFSAQVGASRASRRKLARPSALGCTLVAVSVALWQPRLEARKPPEKFLARFGAFKRVLPRLGAVNRGLPQERAGFEHGGR